MYHSRSIFKQGILFFAFLTFSFLSFHLIAQDGGDINIGQKLTIESKILGQEREILISKPLNTFNAGKNIPVLYLLDGSAHFLYTTGIVSYLSAQQNIPPLIVVGIKNIDRNKDFTPNETQGIPAGGGAEKFHAFIEKELIPFVAKRYYTNDFRILMGHSLGGTFLTYSMLNRPEVFDAYISVSPYLQYNKGAIVKMAKTRFEMGYEEAGSLYMTLGDEPGYTEFHQNFLTLLDEAKTDDFQYKYVVMGDENHGTTPLLSIYRGLGYIFEDWKIPQKVLNQGVNAMDDYNEELSKKYKMDIQSDEASINLLGYAFLRDGKLNMAIKTQEENARRFPESPNVYDSLGDAYKVAGDLKNAEKNYAKAVKLAEDLGEHPFLSTFKKNLENVRMQIHK
jgi:hypothetical protein